MPLHRFIDIHDFVADHQSGLSRKPYSLFRLPTVHGVEAGRMHSLVLILPSRDDLYSSYILDVAGTVDAPDNLYLGGGR